MKCYLTDQAPVNHLTVFLLEKEWERTLIELNCNIHPLEAVSSRIKKELHACEQNVHTASGECTMASDYSNEFIKIQRQISPCDLNEGIH